MPFNDDVVGRPGFLHGGAIAGLLEFAAFTALSRALDDVAVTMKPITVTVDYMRGGTPRDTYAEALIERLGKRMANRSLRLARRARQADRLGPDQFPARPA
jgi:acyl-coenzyme A thioesterase PaaI-like protein